MGYYCEECGSRRSKCECSPEAREINAVYEEIQRSNKHLSEIHSRLCEIRTELREMKHSEFYRVKGEE